MFATTTSQNAKISFVGPSNFYKDGVFIGSEFDVGGDDGSTGEAGQSLGTGYVYSHMVDLTQQGLTLGDLENSSFTLSFEDGQLPADSYKFTDVSDGSVNAGALIDLTYTYNAVPEPGAATALGISLIGIVPIRRRRRS